MLILNEVENDELDLQSDNETSIDLQEINEVADETFWGYIRGDISMQNDLKGVLATKTTQADVNTIIASKGYQNRQEVDTNIDSRHYITNSALNGYATESWVNSKGYLTQHQDISGKVDKVIGKSLVDNNEIGRLSTLHNYDDTQIQADLRAKADKSSVYTKAETNALVSEIPKFAIEVVAVLPSTNISPTTIYLVPNQEEAPNLYDEYIYVDGRWEKLGTQNVDLTGYATESWVEGKGYALANDVPAKVSDLTNDVGYITNAYHDGTKQDLLTQADKQAIADLHQDPTIPTKTSDLTNDSNFISAEEDPSVPAYVKTITQANINAWNKKTYFYVDESMYDVVYDTTKGVSPYSTSYGYTNVTINADAGVSWVEGALYRFAPITKVATSTFRNVRVRIGDGAYIPLCSYAGSGSAQYGLFVKAQNSTFVYETRWFATGGLTNVNYDSNSTYAYLVNTIVGDTTGSCIKIDANGYGARYSLLFPTTSLTDSLTDERYSSLVASSSNATTKLTNTSITKYYIDRHPVYNYSANIGKGAMSTSALYQDYTGTDLRYLGNNSSTYISPRQKAYLVLYDFNESDLSFATAETNTNHTAKQNVVTQDKIKTFLPATTTGDIYLYFLGYTTATWYLLTPNFTQSNKLFKFTPSTGEFHDTNLVVG